MSSDLLHQTGSLLSDPLKYLKKKHFHNRRHDGRATRRNLWFSMMPKDTATYRLQGPGVKSMTLCLVDDPLNLLLPRLKLKVLGFQRQSFINVLTG